MAYYIGTDDLLAALPAGFTVTGSSVPQNLADVASTIFRFEGEVDGFVAAAGYAVPVSTTATYAYATLQQAVTNGAAAWVLGILYPTLGGPADKTSLSSTYRQAYLDFQKAISSGKLSLVGASPAGDAAGSGRVLPQSGGFGRQRIDLCTRF